MCGCTHMVRNVCYVCEAMTHAFDQGRALFLCVLFSACSSKTISVTFKRMCANPNLVGEKFSYKRLEMTGGTKINSGITNVCLK